MLGTPIHVWIVFLVTTAAALVIDLGVFHRKNHTIGLREALLESVALLLARPPGRRGIPHRLFG
jgi:hypothetical protein